MCVLFAVKSDAYANTIQPGRQHVALHPPFPCAHKDTYLALHGRCPPHTQRFCLSLTHHQAALHKHTHHSGGMPAWSVEIMRLGCWASGNPALGSGHRVLLHIAQQGCSLNGRPWQCARFPLQTHTPRHNYPTPQPRLSPLHKKPTSPSPLSARVKEASGRIPSL